jgi:2-octaprenyl-6-methoxyphenol hydroxylase
MKQDSPVYDVMIVGGGMAGASLACALAGSGMQVAIVEAVPLESDLQPSYDVRTISLSYGSRRIYETLGVWQEIDGRAICPIHQIHVSDRGHPGIAHLDKSDADVDALGYVVENRALGAALLGKIGQEDSIDLYCPAMVTDVSSGEEYRLLRCDTDDGEIELAGKLIVLADGGRSGLREKLHFQSSKEEYQQTALVCIVSPGKPHQHCAYERFTPSGPLALLPMNDNRCWCVWATTGEEVEQLLQLEEESFLQRLQETFGDRLGRFSRVGQRYAYPLARSRVEKQVAERAVLIGNAAHTVHPVAAQGFNLGLRDVAWLAEVLTDAHRQGLDTGSLEVLEQYENIRSRDTQRVSGFTHGMIHIFTSRFVPVVAGRNLGLLLTDTVPEIRRALLRRTMGLSGRQSRLARGLELNN